MKKNNLPCGGPSVSSICLGTGTFGSAIPTDTAFAILDAFVENGGNFLDSAHIYAAWLPNGAGASERAIGQWIKSRNCRDATVVATKGGHYDLSRKPRVPRLKPEEIAHDLNESLDRLQTDHIDLYWLHRDDPSIPVGEIIDMLNEHIRQGTINAIGASNWTTQRLKEARDYARDHDLTPFCASQIAWSLATAESETFADDGMLVMDEMTTRFHEQTGLAAIPYSSQAKGFFSGKYAPAPRDDVPKKIRDYANQENFARLARAQELGRQRGCDANAIALAWLLSHPFPVCPIVGPRSTNQIRESCAASDLRLSPEEMRFLTND